MTTQRIALRNSDYDGKGGVHFAGTNFRKMNLDEMRTFSNEAVAKRTNEFKYWHYETVTVEVSIKVLDK